MLVAWRVFLPTLAVLAAIAFGASMLFDLPLLPTLAITCAAVLVNGLVAALEDDLPGGFDNPDGTSTPARVSRAVSIGRWALALVLLTFGIAFLASGLGSGTPADVPLVVGIALSSCLFAVALLARRGWLLLAALASGFGGIALSVLFR